MRRGLEVVSGQAKSTPSGNFGGVKGCCLHVDDGLVVRAGGILLISIEAQVDLLASRLDLGYPLATLLVGAHPSIPA